MDKDNEALLKFQMQILYHMFPQPFAIFTTIVSHFTSHQDTISVFRNSLPENPLAKSYI